MGCAARVRVHLQGVYGRTVCPMCQHGYDAGVLVFCLRTAAGKRSSIADSCVVTAAIDDPRFRPFSDIHWCNAVSTAVAAVSRRQSNGTVAHLATSNLPRRRATQAATGGRAYGYVFAQRRLIASFNPLLGDSDWVASLPRYAHYAMDLIPAAGRATAQEKTVYKLSMRGSAFPHGHFPTRHPVATRLCFAVRLASGWAFTGALTPVDLRQAGTLPGHEPTMTAACNYVTLIPCHGFAELFYPLRPAPCLS